MARDIGFFVFSGHQLLDLAGPLCAFQTAGALADGAPYRLHVLSACGGSVTSNAGFSLHTEASVGAELDTLIVVGGNIARLLEARQVAAFQALAETPRRLASVCTGAFMLAESRRLDGRRATTHWRSAQQLQRDYPAVKVESDRIFVQDGQIWTSAGITAGIDLALALIEDDLGLAVSRAVARELVVYHRRSGGQSQFSALAELDAESGRIRATLSYARDHLTEPLTLEQLAGVACLSVRQFGRAFKRETGETPAKAVERIRADAARSRIADGSEPVESIAESVGFHDPERMRRAFLRLYGQPPQALRRSARSGHGPGAE
ncbi:MAG: GlxA family transcriptional regulator [Polyangiaceae bacterium]